MPKFVIDLHEDALEYINNRAKKDVLTQTDFDKISKLNVVCATAFPVPKDEDWFSESANSLIEKDLLEYKILCNSDDRFLLIRTSRDFDTCFTDKLTGLILHIEGLNVFSGRDDEWERLERWHQIGLRSVGIVWNFANKLGGGTSDEKQGLTLLGAEVIAWLIKKRMIVDLAHMSRKTFFDVSRLIDKPLYVSHANCDSVYKNPRNLDDAQIRTIAETDGVVGICFAGSLVASQKPFIANVVEHINYMKKNIGIRRIAIGSDFGGIISQKIFELESLDKLNNLWLALSSAGYTDEDIEKIAYLNSLRVLKEYL